MVKEPNILLKATNFTVAAIKHLVKGNPTCDQSEIDYRLSICQVCTHFTGIACADKRCGCRINDQRIYLNKLAWSDQSCPQDKWGVPLKNLVTLCITTFKRSEALVALQTSIAKFYPELRQVVVDTRGNLSWGRNHAIKQVTTPYFMLLEDDFVFVEQTNIRLLLQVLQEDLELGIAGGAINSSYCAYDFDEFRFSLRQRPALEFKRNKYGQEYVICDFIDNFGLFRKEMFVDYGWDESLEIHEHINFYYSLLKNRKWRIAVAKDVGISHIRPRPSDEYKKYRKRNFVKQAEGKLGLTFVSPSASFVWPEIFTPLVPYQVIEDYPDEEV